MRQPLNKLLKEYRNRHQLTQSQLAKYLGISEQNISALETGRITLKGKRGAKKQAKIRGLLALPYVKARPKENKVVVAKAVAKGVLESVMSDLEVHAYKLIRSMADEKVKELEAKS